MPTTPEGLPELVTREQALKALAELGVTDHAGVIGFDATLNEITFHLSTRSKAGGITMGRMDITVPIVGVTPRGSTYDSNKWGE